MRWLRLDPELLRITKKLVKISILVMALVAIYMLFTYVFPILGKILSILPGLFLPFILALILAVLAEPVVELFELRLKFKRVWAVLLSLVLIIGGFLSVLSLLVSMVIKEMSDLYRAAISHSNQITAQVMETIRHFRIFYGQLHLPDQMQAGLQNGLVKALEGLQNLLSNSIDVLIQFFAVLPGLLVFIMIGTVATFFIIKDRALLRGLVIGIIPSSARSTSRDVLKELLGALTGFLKAYSILISITTILTLVSLKILGVKYVLTISLLVGLADILPVLGPGAVFLPWIVWQFINGRTGMGISLLAVYIIISVVRQFLEPKIVGDNIGLHPLTTLISLYVGLQLGGAVGLILGPVTVVIFIACYRAGVFDRFDWRKNVE